MTEPDGETGDVVATTVTFLEMARPPAGLPGPPPGFDGSIEPAADLAVQDYRRLVDRVGRPWRWSDFLLRDRAEVAERLAEPDRSIHILRRQGATLGFFEIAPVAGAIELVLFGLVPEATGRGLGRWFLGQALARAWSSGPPRVVTRTCTFDHPAALRLYLGAGFAIVGYQADTIRCLSDRECERLLAQPA